MPFHVTLTSADDVTFSRKQAMCGCTTHWLLRVLLTVGGAAEDPLEVLVGHDQTGLQEALGGCDSDGGGRGLQRGTRVGHGVAGQRHGLSCGHQGACFQGGGSRQRGSRHSSSSSRVRNGWLQRGGAICVLECRRQRNVVMRGHLSRGLARRLGRHVRGLLRPSEMHEGRRLLLRRADSGGDGSGRRRTESSLRGSLNDGSCIAAGGRGCRVEGEGDEGVGHDWLGGRLEAEGFSKALWEEADSTVSARHQRKR